MSGVPWQSHFLKVPPSRLYLEINPILRINWPTTSKTIVGLISGIPSIFGVVLCTFGLWWQERIHFWRFEPETTPKYAHGNRCKGQRPMHRAVRYTLAVREEKPILIRPNVYIWRIMDSQQLNYPAIIMSTKNKYPAKQTHKYTIIISLSNSYSDSPNPLSPHSPPKLHQP